jgi:hypothetical protein
MMFAPILLLFAQTPQPLSFVMCCSILRLTVAKSSPYAR